MRNTSCFTYLLQKEFLQMRRNSFMPKIILLFPLMVMCVMPWVMNMEVKGIVVDIVDQDHGVAAQRLVQRIAGMPQGRHGKGAYFVMGNQRADYASALSDVEHGRADVILQIPRHYSRDLSLGLHPQVLIAANAVNGTKGSIGAAYLSQLLGSGDAEMQSAGPARRNAPNSKLLYNPHQSYKVFMIPALMGILLMMLCGFLPALNIVGEKEAGTIEQINVTPVKKHTFILAKLVPYWVVALVVMTLCFVLSWLVYGITCQGSLWLVYVLAMLLALFFSSLGLVVSNYSDTLQQAMLVMWFFVVCMMLLSGLFTPVRSMPHWAWLTTYVNPMHYFIDAMRTVFVRGGDLAAVARQMGAIAVLAMVMGAWAVTSYRKRS